MLPRRTATGPIPWYHRDARDLLDEFVGERTKLEKEEMESKHAYDMLVTILKAQIEQAIQDRDEEAKTKARKLEAKAQA